MSKKTLVVCAEDVKASVRLERTRQRVVATMYHFHCHQFTHSCRGPERNCNMKTIAAGQARSVRTAAPPFYGRWGSDTDSEMTRWAIAFSYLRSADLARSSTVCRAFEGESVLAWADLRSRAARRIQTAMRRALALIEVTYLRCERFRILFHDTEWNDQKYQKISLRILQ